MFISRHMGVRNKPFETVKRFKYSKKTVTNQNYIQE